MQRMIRARVQSYNSAAHTADLVDSERPGARYTGVRILSDVDPVLLASGREVLAQLYDDGFIVIVGPYDTPPWDIGWNAYTSALLGPFSLSSVGAWTQLYQLTIQTKRTSRALYWFTINWQGNNANNPFAAFRLLQNGVPSCWQQVTCTTPGEWRTCCVFTRPPGWPASTMYPTVEYYIYNAGDVITYQGATFMATYFPTA
ncbi:MAG: hypothetical protein JXA74_17225 [Anaerolineae bacterium]|nr:hypothetical protein [Anaerolineae bacterium]